MFTFKAFKKGFNPDPDRIRNSKHCLHSTCMYTKGNSLTLGIVYSTMVNLNHQLFLDGRYGADVKLTGIYLPMGLNLRTGATIFILNFDKNHMGKYIGKYKLP